MTDAHQEHDSPHEGPVKTPRQVILAVLFGFVVPVVGIVLLAIYVATAPRPGAGSDALSQQAVAERLRPVGRVEVRDATDVASLKSGEQVYAAQCAACHAAGVAGAPKSGDTAAWAPRIGHGYEVLLTSALKGKGAMGPQGGGDFSDVEIGRAVVYMANRSGAKFAEPQPPAAGAAGQVAAAGAASGAAAAASAPAAAMTPASGVLPGAIAAAGAAAPASAAAASASAMTASAAPAAAGVAPAPGSDTRVAAAAPPLYAQMCMGCHGPGIAGAPKVGDKAAWAPRIAQGMEAVHANAIKGKGAMPPRGGAMTASDADIRAVVVYMVEASR